MSLVPYTITAIERDVANASASGKQVVIGAICSMTDSGGADVIMYDDANNTNGELTKTTNANGQVIVYVQAGVYTLTIGTISRAVNVPSDPATIAAEIASKPTSIDNVATMKSTTSLVAGNSVICTRYYSGGELVDGLNYYIKTAAQATADGDVIDGYINHTLTNTNVAILVFTDKVNVKQAGAVGDGTAIDSTSIQACIDRVGNSSSNGTIYFPKGQYRTNTTLDMSAILRVPNIIGDSSSTTTILAESFSASQPIFDITRTLATRINDRTFSGFTLRDNTNNAYGMNLSWVAQSAFRDIGLYSLAGGINVGSTIYSCVFEQVKTSLPEGFAVTLRDECNNLLFNNCILSGKSVGLRMLDDSYAVKFNNCDFEQGTSYHAEITPATGTIIKGLSFDNCYFENGATFSIYIRPDDADGLQGFEISNCYFTVQPSTTDGAIYLRNCTKGTVSNCSANRYVSYFYNRDGTAKYLKVNNNSYDCPDLNSAGAIESATAFSTLVNNATGRTETQGLGSPEGVLTAIVGSTYIRTDGGTGTVFYVKETGTGNTGWVAK